MDREAWQATILGVASIKHVLAAKQQQQASLGCVSLGCANQLLSIPSEWPPSVVQIMSGLLLLPLCSWPGAHLQQFSSVQFSSVAQSCPTLCNPVDCSTPGLPVHHQLLEFTQTHVHWVSEPSNHLILCHPLLLLPSIVPSIRVFSNESVLRIRWPNYWSFSFCIGPSNEYSGLISFRMDWLDLHAVQGTLKSLLHHHSSKAPIIWRSAFFIVQLSHPYMTTGKTSFD